MTEPLFDISEWLGGLVGLFLSNCSLQAIYEATEAEHELDYYTDPRPYDCPQIMWRNPHYVGWKSADGVVRVYRAGEEPVDIERVVKGVEQITYTLTDLFGGDEDRWMGRV